MFGLPHLLDLRHATLMALLGKLHSMVGMLTSPVCILRLATLICSGVHQELARIV